MKTPMGKTLSENRFISTGLVVLFSALLLASGEFATLWPIFGSANQLLAALALLTIAVWMIRQKKNALFVTVPMFFMFTVTLASLGLFAWKNFQDQVYVLSLIAALLFVLAISLMILATRSIKKEIKEPAKAL